MLNTISTKDVEKMLAEISLAINNAAYPDSNRSYIRDFKKLTTKHTTI